MWVRYKDCHKSYDDTYNWTICPHNPLGGGHRPEDFCFKHDFFAPCPICKLDKEKESAVNRT